MRIPKEYIILLTVLVGGIIIHSLHFGSYLNFSTDQAAFSIRALEILKNKNVELIGPSISFHYIGRDIYQGSITYYVILLFLLVSNFDPILGSYLYMLVSMIMVIPLYLGVKKLVNQPAAFFVAGVYSFLPFYIDYSRFFWNPNFQFSFTPLLILFIGLFNKTAKNIYAFLVGFSAGILLLFHYQYAIVIAGLLIYYSLLNKTSFKQFLLLTIGVTVGFSPLIIFELRNQFYNLQTILLYLQNSEEIFTSTSSFNFHYILSISLFALTILAYFLRNYLHRPHILTGIIVILSVTSFVTYILPPSHAFGMKDSWNFIYEKKANDIIMSQDTLNYNIVHQGYDTVATVQKFLLKTKGVSIDYDDYYHNKYLYIISDRKDYMDDPAYEVATFKPSIEIKNWKINNKYILYLRSRK